MAQDWYVQSVDGTVSGPFTEKDVADKLLAGTIGEGQFVRQGDQSEWCEAQRARLIFQRLAESGWYIKDDNHVFGPFTDTKLLELYRSSDVSSSALLRQGTEGDWKSAHALLSQWQQQNVNATPNGNASESRAGANKWSVAPFRHVIVELEVNATTSCQPNERLNLRDDGKNPITIERTCGQLIGQLSSEDTRQVRFNMERGITHLAFALNNQEANRVAVVFCPPGADPAMCHKYLDEHFRAPEIIPQTESGSGRFVPRTQ